MSMSCASIGTESWPAKLTVLGSPGKAACRAGFLILSNPPVVPKNMCCGVIIGEAGSWPAKLTVLGSQGKAASRAGFLILSKPPVVPKDMC
jgi:hypothetical protein